MRLRDRVALRAGHAVSSGSELRAADWHGMRACHTVFPELTPFGREFKLNGYVLDNMKQVTGIDTSANQTLALNSIPPISLMLQVSYTRTGKPVPDSVVSGALVKNVDLLFPQQVSFFYAGKIADGLGAFLQLTYDGAEDHFGFDNTDIRYAHHWSFGGSNENDHDLILGLKLNNNPTVQDAWNTTPAWGFPYSNSSTAPGSINSAKIDSGAGGFRQSVGGLGVYAWLDSHFYAEITDYTSAITGSANFSPDTTGYILERITCPGSIRNCSCSTPVIRSSTAERPIMTVPAEMPRTTTLPTCWYG